MMVRIEYEGGRTTLFDTLSFTEGSPFSGANMLTEFELEMRDEPEKGLWLTANWHQVRDDWRADATADGIPAARRSRGWRFMLASEAELGRARRVLLDGDEASCSTATRRSPGCGDTCATRPRSAPATASTWALPQNR